MREGNQYRFDSTPVLGGLVPYQKVYDVTPVSSMKTRPERRGEKTLLIGPPFLCLNRSVVGFCRCLPRPVRS